MRLADQSPGRLGHRFPVHIPRGYVLVELDRLDQARTTIESGVRISEELGIGWGLAVYYVVRALERFIAGHWDDAVAEIETGTGVVSVTGDSYNPVLGRSVLSLIRLHRNDLPGVRDAVGAASGELSALGGYRAGWSAWARALLLEADGELADAFQTLSDCWDRCARSGSALEYPVIGPDLVRLALAAGELALTCEDAGAAVARRGDVARACQLLDQAITVYERLDAARDLARAEAALRQMGVRRGRHVTHRRAQSGWQSLTPSERAVVDLVAEGLSNPEIGQRLYVSRRTVQTHLAHVFAKLHISSRAQLAAEAARHRR